MSAHVALPVCVEATLERAVDWSALIVRKHNVSEVGGDQAETEDEICDSHPGDGVNVSDVGLPCRLGRPRALGADAAHDVEVRTW